MPAEHYHKGQGDKNFTEANKHNRILRCRAPKVNVDYTILGNLPTKNGK